MEARDRLHSDSDFGEASFDSKDATSAGFQLCLAQERSHEMRILDEQNHSSS